MTNPDHLIEDILIQFVDEIRDADATIRNAAAQIHAWRLLAKTAYSAFQDLYGVCHEGGAKGVPADLMYRNDYKRMKNWKAEVDKCRLLANEVEGKQP